MKPTVSVTKQCSPLEEGAVAGRIVNGFLFPVADKKSKNAC